MVWTLPAEAAELQVLDRLQVDGNTISPYGGIGRYENLLIYSEAFDDATSGTNWAETNMAGTANSTAAPNGTTTADTLTVQTASPGQTQQVVTTTVTLPYTFSVWAKSGTTTDLQLELTTNGTGATTDNATFVLTSIWQRYSVTKSAGAGTSPTTVTARIKSAGLVGQTLYVWGAQLEQSATAGVYVRTTTSSVAASQGAVTDGTPTGTGSGTVTNVATGTGLTGGPITATGTLSLDYARTLASNNLTAGQAVFDSTDNTNTGGLLFEGATANTFQTYLTVVEPTADRTISLPNETGTLCTTGSVCAGYQASLTLPLSVANGGTGAATFTANGLLYGNTTSALQVTAQGAANTVLTANAGAPAFSAAPTIGTSVTTPLLIGGTTTTSPLTLKTTTGVGTTNADMIFQVGNNGATEALRILNNGNVGIGSTNKLSRLTVTPGADVTNIGGTTTASAATTITGSGTTFTTSLGIGDRIALSSAASTYATVTAIASDTSLTVDTALGNGTSQTINAKRSIFRLDDAANTTKLVVNDLGNVGIGTTQPTQKLSVNGDIGALGGPCSSLGAGSGYTFFTNDTDGGMVSPADGQIAFCTNTSERVRLSGSNVGIGTTAPAGLLHTATSTTALGLNIYEQASADADSYDVNFRKARGTVASPTVITTADELGTIAFRGYGGASGYVTGAAIKAISSGTIADTRIPGFLSFWTGTDATPTVLTERMRIDNAGKVGVGTTAPAAPFHLASGASGQSPTSVDGMFVENNGSSNTFYVFQTATVGGGKSFSITNAGNVGIGTTNPTAVLHLKAGTATANTSPLKLTAGTNLTTPEAGAIEFDGTNLTYTNSTPTRVTLATTTGGIALSSLTAAGATNTLANTNKAQTWNWDTLATETAMSLGSTSITSGKMLSLPSTATAFTGTMLDASLTGSATANTGTVMKASVTGALSVAVPLMATNLGTGASFRVNDETGDADATPFLIDASGNVGIGTTSPTNAKLHLAGTDSGGYAATIRLQNQNASGADAFIAASDANWTAGSNKMLFGLGGAPSSANTKMVIDSSGNVGIGTTGPSAKLNVLATGTGFVNTATFEADPGDTGDIGNDAVTIKINNKNSTNYKSSIELQGNGSTKWDIGNDINSSGAQQFFIWNGVSSTNPFAIHSNGGITMGGYNYSNTPPANGLIVSGNVGIGSTTKLSRLTVTPAADVTNIGGTTTANASQTITGSGTTFLSSVGVGDRIALSSAASTYATVTHMTSDTSLRVDAALGNGTSQTINKKSSFLRLDDTASVAHLLVNDQGITSINSVKLGAPLLPDNAGAVSWIDVPVTSSATSGTVESYTAQIDSQPLLTIYAKSDGVGGIQNSGVGIGTTSPVSILHVAASTGVITIDSAGTPGESVVSGRASRGTLASPTAVQLNDRIFRLTARGYGTTTFGTTDNASVVLAAAENFTDTAKGTYIALETTPLGTTSRTERVRIDNAGNVGIAMTSPGVKLQVNGGVSIATLGASGSTSHYLCIQQNSPATGYNYISDCGASLGALKTDIQPISEGLSTLMQLEPVQYKWKSTGEPDIGFIAEDVQRVSPTYLAAYNADGSLYGVNYIHFSAVLAKALQELNGLAVKRDSNGNVGIGTTSPSFLLSLGNAADQTFGMEDQGVNTTAGRSLTVQAGAGGSSGTGNVGGSLTLKAGIAQGSAANAGGALILTPGTSTSTGATGYVQLSGGAAGAHFRATQTTAPTIGTPTSCGTSPSATITDGSTDMAGRLNITAGSGSPGNCAAVITFDQAYAAAPKAILLTPLTTNGPARNIWVSATAAGTCTVTMATAPAASQANSWYYLVIE